MIYLSIITRCGSILMSKLTDTAESQKRTETKGCSRMTVYQRIANQNAILIMLEYNFLFQDNTTYAIRVVGTLSQSNSRMYLWPIGL